MAEDLGADSGGDEAAPRTKPPLWRRVVGSLEKQGVVIVVREGRLRASPHFYNTQAQIDQLVDALP